jgi:chemotaxis protein CheD
VSAAVLASAGAASSEALLAGWRRQPRGEGEARTFLWDLAFRMPSVKLMPGEYFVHDRDDLLITTVLGSCVAVCLLERSAGLGGMNHFMLPDGGSAGRYGVYAMEVLINTLMKRGARRDRLEAKVFGGAQVLRAVTGLGVGEHNVRFIDAFLEAERIPLVSRDVLGTQPRKVCLLPAAGRVLVRKLADANADDLARAETALRHRLGRAATVAGAGSVEWFDTPGTGSR